MMSPENEDATARKAIGAQVKERRLSTGLSQAQLGRKIGKTGTFIAALEAGRVVFTEDLLSDLGSALGISLKETP
jgi:ribosome-binding protein aMBF1 (putative translation factor)